MFFLAYAFFTLCLSLLTPSYAISCLIYTEGQSSLKLDRISLSECLIFVRASEQVIFAGASRPSR